jgi:5-formyltetrahydrofolate cyclo-ligase
MGLSLQAQKAGLREEVRTRVAGISKEAREEASAKARALLQRQAGWQKAGFVLLYAPLAMELDIGPLLEDTLKAGKVVALPRFDRGTNRYEACQVKDPLREVELGRYGILEPVRSCDPVRLNRLDFTLVPGVAFDLHGRRLGRGRGYYDVLLAEVSGKTCGVAFDEQIVREVPVDSHDSDVNCILTPTRWIEL